MPRPNLLLGEKDGKGVAKGKPVITGACFWCQEKVWSSSVVFSSDDPGSDLSLTPELLKQYNLRPLHKFCLIDILEIGKETMIALDMNLKTR